MNDFPTYGNLSDHYVKDYKACPICSEGTHVIRLTNYRKETYISHRRFWDNNHPYRMYRKICNGEQEWDSAPKSLSVKEIYKKVSQVITQFGTKPRNNAEVGKKAKRKEKRKGKGKEKGKRKSKGVKIENRVQIEVDTNNDEKKRRQKFGIRSQLFFFSFLFN